jgi:hypothetical protein
MTPEQIEDVIERTASRTATRIREEVQEDFRAMLTGLGFNMDPDKMHEEQQMVAFARTMYTGTRRGVFAFWTGIIGAASTVFVGTIVWFFTGRPHP